jgi:glycosyltransferase involved in cell wall biosynthesis
VKIVALTTVYNERRVITAFLHHCAAQNIHVYLTDNSSTDNTVELARPFLGRHLIAIDTLPRPNGFDLPAILQHHTELAAVLDADWFVHLDADELLVSGHGHLSLHDAFEQADRLGFNAIHFMEYVFVPTQQTPEHTSEHFVQTMRWYYPFLPRIPHRLIAWKKQRHPVDLLSTGGHAVSFEGLRVYPRWLAMKHYICLNLEHALEKWGHMTFSPEMIRRGWGVRRCRITANSIAWPSEENLRTWISDDGLDPSFPEKSHRIFRPEYAQ